MTQEHNILFYSGLLARHQYAFVDRAVVPAETLEGLPIIPLVPRELRSDAQQMPALLPLAPEAPYMERLSVAMKMGEDNATLDPVDTLIAVAPDISQNLLASHLTSRLIVHFQRNKAFLRYYSSDIFPHLVRVLPPGYLKSLFGRRGEVQKWTYRFQGDWISVPVPYVSEGEGVPNFWAVTAEQRKVLDIAGEINQTLDEYRAKMGRPWNDCQEWEVKARVTEYSIGIAQQHLSDPDDLKAFALHALTHGEHFYRHPAIENILHNAASSPGAYREATRHLTENEWAKVAAEALTQI